MATLSELKKAFSSYRRRSGQKRNQNKYPEQLKRAIQSFSHDHPEITLLEIADAVGVTAITVRKWISRSSHSGFTAVKVEDNRKPARIDGHTQISSGNVSISLGEDATPEEVERVIKLLTAG
jgi:predicted transcriptional regulator